MRTGRPRSVDTDETLERAIDHFWRRGYRSTTTRALESSLLALAVATRTEIVGWRAPTATAA